MRPTKKTNPAFKNYHDLVTLAQKHGFFVTSTKSGQHNVGSRHYLGLAIDVRTRDKTDKQIAAFRRICESFGIWFYDERKRPRGQKVWTGPHIHLEIIK